MISRSITVAAIVAATFTVGPTSAPPPDPPAPAPTAQPPQAADDPAPQQPDGADLTGVNWLGGTYPSPCTGGDGAPADVTLIAGAAVIAEQRVVLEDVHPLDADSGLAVAWLSCERTEGEIAARIVAVVHVGGDASFTTLLARQLPHDAEVVALDLPQSFTIEFDDGPGATAGCCAQLVRRQTMLLTADGIEVTGERRIAAFHRTATVDPLVGANVDLVRTSVTPSALCFRWAGESFTPRERPADPDPPRNPGPELETVRLALIHTTGTWIRPASFPTPAFGRAVEAFQEDRGLFVDGIAGHQTLAALAAELGCPGVGSFRQVDPPMIGPRHFASVEDLVAATRRYATAGTSGNESFDALLAAAAWDGANAMFVGCVRRSEPRIGVTCSFSGATALQLVGLVDDRELAGVGSFSVMYARTTAPQG